MVTRVIRDEADLRGLFTLLKSRKLPLTVNVLSGVHRTDNQNRLQRKWLQEVSEQLGDRTPEEVRGDAKLRFGVPILRAENDAFAAQYDAFVKPLPYEQKLALMMEPLDMPVTRLMTTKQKVQYLDTFSSFYARMGVVLTAPGGYNG